MYFAIPKTLKQDRGFEEGGKQEEWNCGLCGTGQLRRQTSQWNYKIDRQSWADASRTVIGGHKHHKSCFLDRIMNQVGCAVPAPRAGEDRYRSRRSNSLSFFVSVQWALGQRPKWLQFQFPVLVHSHLQQSLPFRATTTFHSLHSVAYPCYTGRSKGGGEHNTCYHHFYLLSSLPSSSDSWGFRSSVSFDYPLGTDTSVWKLLQAVCNDLRTVGMLIGNRYGWHLGYSRRKKFWNCRMLGLSFEKASAKRLWHPIRQEGSSASCHFLTVWALLFYLRRPLELTPNMEITPNSQGYGDRTYPYIKVELEKKHAIGLKVIYIQLRLDYSYSHDVWAWCWISCRFADAA